MNTDELAKLLGLNIGIAATDVALFSPGLIGIQLGGASALATAFGCTAIFMSGALFLYGNYKLLAGREKVVQTSSIKTIEDYSNALRQHRYKKTFETNINLMLEQIERLVKKKSTILDILQQRFSVSELSYKKFASVINEVEKIFYLNIRSILNKLNAFDEEEYIRIKDGDKSGGFSQEFIQQKLSVYNEYIAFINKATEDNEEIILKLDKLLLEISSLDSLQDGEIEKMPGMQEIDELIKQTRLYK